MILEYVDVSTGEVLDTVTVTGDQLTFATGAAEQMFAIRQDAFGWTPAEAFKQLDGWSNGYAALRPR